MRLCAMYTNMLIVSCWSTENSVFQLVIQINLNFLDETNFLFIQILYLDGFVLISLRFPILDFTIYSIFL